MEWYSRLGSAVMLLASGIVAIVVVERLHDLRRSDDTAFLAAPLPSDAAAPLVALRLARASWPAVFVQEYDGIAVIEGEFRKAPRARCDACTGTHPDEVRDERCW